MNVAHVHLLLNHFPTVGMVIAVGLFLFSMLGNSDYLKRVSLGLFFFLAVLTMPAYLTGKAAEEVIEERPDISHAMLERHEDDALLGFVMMEITGGLAWLALWKYRRTARLAGWNMAAVLLMSLLTMGLMARAASVGGEVVHPEIRAPGANVDAPSQAWLTAAGISTYVNEKPWVWPASETLHFIGLFVIFGVVLLVNLRILGVMKSVSFAALHGLIPVGLIGFAVNMFTGMLFFIATPGQYTQNPAFLWKVILMVLAGANVLYLTVIDETFVIKAGDNAPLTGKLVAVATICMTIGIIYFGRMLPFIGNSF
jgi:uncharacterized membrane protein